MSSTRLKLVIIVGVGNIGSYAAPLVARIPGVGLVVLVDKDSYEERNLAGQNITREDVGRSKVQVIGRRLRDNVREIVFQGFSSLKKSVMSLPERSRTCHSA